MKKPFMLVLFISCIMGFSCSSNETAGDSSKKTAVQNSYSAEEKESISIAQSWLSLIDNENYEKSWDESAKIFQNSISKDQWTATIKNVRSNFGKLLEREIASASFTTSLPGTPDGEYVVIRFNSKFEKKEHAVETITPMKDVDGKWRVSGYFIN